MSLSSLVEKPALLLIDQSEEWLVQSRYVSETSLRQVLSSDTTVAENVNTNEEGLIELNAAWATEIDHRITESPNHRITDDPTSIITNRYLATVATGLARSLNRGAKLPGASIGQDEETTNEQRATGGASGHPARAYGKTGGGFAEGQVNPEQFEEDEQVGSYATGEEDPEKFPEDEQLGRFARGQEKTDSPENLEEGTFATGQDDSAEE